MFENLPELKQPLTKEVKMALHCVKSVQIRSYFWSVIPVFTPNTEKYGPEITPYLDSFHAVLVFIAGYVARRSGAVDDAHVYVDEYGAYFKKLNRGDLIFPGDSVC